jgi:VCBS repeat-containing protein
MTHKQTHEELSLEPQIYDITELPFPQDLDPSKVDEFSGLIFLTEDGDTANMRVTGGGDFNGDGIDDIAISTPRLNDVTGRTYVVFGTGENTGSATISLADLDGSNGVIIEGAEAGDYMGGRIAFAGDTNGDGIDDLMLAGVAGTYIVFGREGEDAFERTIDLAAINNSQGVFFVPEEANDVRGTTFANAVGDINNDGLSDIIISDANIWNDDGDGKIYVIYGQNSDEGGFAEDISLATLTEEQGFTVVNTNNFAYTVSRAGDVNNDGIDDFMVSDGLGLSAYVIFGRDKATDGNFPASFDVTTLDGSNGFGIGGVSFAYQGLSSLGDINGDGIDDISLSTGTSGKSYVIFGRDGDFEAVVSLATLTSDEGFIINTPQWNVAGRHTISSAGDINGDGIGDMVVSVSISDSDDGPHYMGYVLYGKDTTGDDSFAAEYNFSDLDGTDGFRLTTDTVSPYQLDNIASIGSFNGDNNGGFVIANSTEGRAYVVYGREENAAGSIFHLVTEDITELTGQVTTDDPGGIVAAVVEGKHGTLTVNADGTWHYVVEDDINYLTNDTRGIIVNNIAYEPATLSFERFTITSDNGSEFKLSVDILGTNDAPETGDAEISLDRSGFTTFSASDFPFEDVDSLAELRGVQAIRIESLPGQGSLTLNGQAVTAGDEIDVADLGALRFTAPNADGSTSFTFSVKDAFDWSAAGGTMNITYVKTNNAPSSPALTSDGVAENAAGAFVGTLSATDVDGDAVSYSVSDERFRVEGNELWLADGVALDFEATPELSVRVTATDSIGATSVRFATVHVLDRDESIALPGTDGRDALRGSDGNDTLTGGMGSDTLVGGAGNDTLFAGSAGEDDSDSAPNHLWAGGGNDEATGSGGDDLIGGSDGNDMLNGMGGDDTLYGAEGSDTLTGGAGDDLLYNGAGDDSASGGAGDDILWGGADNDTLSGGDGGDSFIFANGHGTDTITDFNVDEDTLDLSLIAGIDDFSDLAAEDATSGGETGVLLHTSESSSIFLAGVTLSALEAVTTIN